MTESDRVRRQRELAELDREFQRKQREFREDLNQRRNEEMQGLLERSNAHHPPDRRAGEVRPDSAGGGVLQSAHRHHRARAEGAQRCPIVAMKAGSVSLAELTAAVVERSAGRLQAIIVGDPPMSSSAASLRCGATRSDLAFLANPLYRADALTTQCRCDRAQRGRPRTRCNRSQRR